MFTCVFEWVFCYLSISMGLIILFTVVGVLSNVREIRPNQLYDNGNNSISSKPGDRKYSVKHEKPPRMYALVNWGILKGSISQ